MIQENIQSCTAQLAYPRGFGVGTKGFEPGFDISNVCYTWDCKWGLVVIRF